MSFWTAAVVIVAIIAYACIRISQHNSKAQRPHGPRVEEGETRSEIEELRERIKVLEKITVDGREARAIADEIESLRDKQDKQRAEN